MASGQVDVKTPVGQSLSFLYLSLHLRNGDISAAHHSDEAVIPTMCLPHLGKWHKDRGDVSKIECGSRAEDWRQCV
jgi:hypothetical protein